MRRLFTIVCACVIAGCSGPPQAAEGRELTAAEKVQVRHAEQLLVKECMEAAGFRYWIAYLPTADQLDGGGYLVTDVSWARRNGYGSRFSDRIDEIQRTDPNARYANGLPEHERARYSATLDGLSSGSMVTARLPGGRTVQASDSGCLAEAKGRLYGDFETWFQVEKIAENLSMTYVGKVLKDSRFVRALETWSTCMTSRGYDVADPPGARELLTRLTNGMTREESFAVEVELAVAEASCANATPLAETARAVRDEYHAKELRRYGEDVATYERMSVAALGRAREIVGSSS